MTYRLPPWIDRFLLWLVATVLVASLLPATGRAAAAVELAADAGIALLFFLHGARLSRGAIVQGMGNYRLHLMVLASTFILFPAIGIALSAAARSWFDANLLVGLLYLTLLPSTVQSSIAFTAMARGNVAAAVCSASLSNLAGILLTPVLVALLLHLDAGGAGGLAGPVRTIALQLLLPFVAGHLLRPLIGSWVDRHKAMLQPVDRAAILLVVYSAFSAAVAAGLWSRLGIGELAALLVACAVILAIVLGANVLAARAAKLERADAVVLLFCGSKKSLASGVPMAGALFDPSHVGIVVLPLMIFHQLQLMVCAMLAGRMGRQAAAVPVGGRAATVAAARAGLPIPPEARAGVVANLALLGGHAATLRGDRP